MDGLSLWRILEDRIRPFYPNAGNGRRPYPLAAMLRVHCVQLCYNLSVPGMDDLPGETAILNFRRLLERHRLARGLKLRGRRHRGRRHHRGAVIRQEPLRGAGPGDTPDQEGEPVALRDEGPHRGGIGDGDSASVSATPANAHDVTEARNLLHAGRRWCGATMGIILLCRH